jgi:hypothetical protein
MRNDLAWVSVKEMMRRFAFLTMLSLCLAAAVLASSASESSAMHSKPAVDGATFSFAGRVTKVDYASNIVDMTTNGRRVRIKIEPTTAIDVNGEPGGISDIEPGVRLQADGVIRGGSYVAQSISVHSDGTK